jgi:hypothetical protein
MSTCEKDFTKLSINIEGTNSDQLYFDLFDSNLKIFHPTGLKEDEAPNSMVHIKSQNTLNMINPIIKNSKPDEDFKLDICVANKCVNKTSPMVMIDTSKKYKILDLLPRINKTLVTCYNNVSSDIGPDPDSIIHKCSIGEYQKTIGRCMYAPDFYFPHLKIK